MVCSLLPNVGTNTRLLKHSQCYQMLSSISDISCQCHFVSSRIQHVRYGGIRRTRQHMGWGKQEKAMPVSQISHISIKVHIVCLWVCRGQDCNRGLSLFSFWKRAKSDCLHTRLKGEWIVDIRRMNRRTMDIVNLICRQSLSALFQKLNNDKPLLGDFSGHRHI